MGLIPICFITNKIKNMSLRDRPYFPLYVHDFMVDERLAECSAAATGVYIRLMCLMHKSEHYGKILLQQNGEICYNKVATSEICYNKIVTKFAQKLSRLMPYDVSEIENSLLELLGKNVVKIEKKKGKSEEFFLLQKRMVRDGELSDKRSKAGKSGMLIRYKSGAKGGEICYNKSDNKFITNGLTNQQQNAEDEDEDEYYIKDHEKREKEKEGVGEKEKGKKVLFDLSFLEDDFKNPFVEWMEYKHQRKETYKTQKSVETCYMRLKKLSGFNPENASLIVEQSMANNWAGLFELKISSNGKTGNNNNLQSQSGVSDDYKRNILERLLTPGSTEQMP
jgi:hypothetical protein